MRFSARRLLILVVALVALAAAPAPAMARGSAAAQVRGSAHGAKVSLRRVARLVHANRDARAARQLRVMRRQLRTGERALKRLRHSRPNSRAYAQGARRLGLVSDQCADTLTSLVDEAAGNPQVAIANAITACLGTREHVIEQLTSLLDQAPEQLRPFLSQAISLLSDDSAGDVADLTQLLKGGELPPRVADALQQAADLATTAIDQLKSHLGDVVSQLPPEARPLVQSVLDDVTAQLGQVQDLLKGLLQDVNTNPSTPPSDPTDGGGSQTPPPSSQQPDFEQLLHQLLGGLFPDS